MIISLDQYRKAANSGNAAADQVETYEQRRLFGNTLPKLNVAEIQYHLRRSAGPQLPDDFEGVDMRELRLNAYALATQI
ncbi:MAG: hypothetical protein FJY56_18890 [Betaproteobacteria bacterium]|nr:hypothetical protein [Betaproteobacteria bacterium]